MAFFLKKKTNRQTENLNRTVKVLNLLIYRAPPTGFPKLSNAIIARTINIIDQPSAFSKAKKHSFEQKFLMYSFLF